MDYSDNNKTELFIEKANLKHNNFFNYSESNYIHSLTPIDIICPNHGLFSITPKSHLKGTGCPVCSGSSITTDSFVQKAVGAHNGKYDYSLVEYKDSKTKVKIICSEHGVFEQLPSVHLSGSGCPVCSNVKKMTTNSFVEKSISIHGNKYDYSLVEYTNNKTKVKIICSEHGMFEQSPNKHLSGHGCPPCSSRPIEKRNGINKIVTPFVFDISKFIEKSIEKHGNKYDYSLVEYKNNKTKIKIICPEHGVFEQRPNDHLYGRGCKFCSSQLDTKAFIQKAVSIHGNKYDYSLVEYTGTFNKVKIICPEHGIFEQRPNDHKNGHGCRLCYSQDSVSSQETEVHDYISSIYSGEVIRSYRPEWLNGKELDIFIPEFNFAIEFNGTYWHSEEKKDKWYHFEKTKVCRGNNIKLLHIWEFKWMDLIKKEIYKSIINHHLQMDKRVFARNCSIVDIELPEAIQFMQDNHVEGFSIPYKDSFSIGLLKDNKVVMIAIVGKYFIQKENSFKWKLQRICTELNTTVVGGISKLSKEIQKRIGSFSYQIAIDTGGTTIPKEINIEREDVTLRYWWIKNNTVKTRNRTQSHILKKNADWIDGDSENSYMIRNGYIKIYDSGIYNFLK